MNDGCVGCGHFDGKWCNYYLNTKKRRGCPAGAECTHHPMNGEVRKKSIADRRHEEIFAAEDAATGNIVYGPTTAKELADFAGIQKCTLYENIRHGRIKRNGPAGGCRFVVIEPLPISPADKNTEDAETPEKGFSRWGRAVPSRSVLKMGRFGTAEKSV